MVELTEEILLDYIIITEWGNKLQNLWGFVPNILQLERSTINKDAVDIVVDNFTSIALNENVWFESDSLQHMVFYLLLFLDQHWSDENLCHIHIHMFVLHVFCVHRKIDQHSMNFARFCCVCSGLLTHSLWDYFTGTGIVIQFPSASQATVKKSQVSLAYDNISQPKPEQSCVNIQLDTLCHSGKLLTNTPLIILM